jgi:hypothetical protein
MLSSCGTRKRAPLQVQSATEMRSALWLVALKR